MSSDHRLFVSWSSQERPNVVAQALMEKLEKLQTARELLEHEREAQREAAAQLEARFNTIEAQISELRNALAQQPSGSSMLEGPTLSAGHRQKAVERTERTLLNSERFPSELYFETRTQKHTALMVARGVLEAFGSMHLRDLFGLLQQKGVEISSPQRLSQILSESNEFEADRAKGWSLKR